MTRRRRRLRDWIGGDLWPKTIAFWSWATRDVWSITRLLERCKLPRPIAESLVVAGFLGASSLVLEHETGYLDWLDVAMLQVVPAVDIVPFRPPRDVAPEILVLTIGDRFFETEFGGQTPIPRAAFTELLKAVVKTFRPKVLAVDYDLSPGCGDLAKGKPAGDRPECGGALRRDEAGRRQLDDYVRSRPVEQLVLIRPLPVGDPALCKIRLEWERRMRGAGVKFGEPDLVHHGLFDAVVKYERRPDSFAHQIHCSAFPEGDACVESSPHAGAERCRTREQLRTQPIARKKLDPLNFLHAVRGVPTYELANRDSVEAARAYHRGDFRVVFVGGDYDSSDLFNTPVGEKSGVALHAYSAYSIHHRLPSQHGWALVIDVALGTLAGVFLLKSWGEGYAQGGPFERLWRACLSLGILGLAWALILLVARGLMLQDMWINPGPMLVAMFVKTWHSSVKGAEHEHLDTSHAPARTPGIRDRVVGVLYCAVFIGVLGWTVFILRELSRSH